MRGKVDGRRSKADGRWPMADGRRHRTAKTAFYIFAFIHSRPMPQHAFGLRPSTFGLRPSPLSHSLTPAQKIENWKTESSRCQNFYSMNQFNINRRHFLKGAAASLALTAFGTRNMDIFNPSKSRRVALIGTGWYGKRHLFRLIQVAPVEVVALCDVDKKMLAEAGAMVSQRQKSGKTPKLYS